MMSPVTIYTMPTCPYCRYAKNLLTSKGVSFEEIDASDPSARKAMIERAPGSYTVPQIFIGSRHIGGCDDLYALDAKGELDPLLQS
jgi:glutaredoxin 3